MKTINTILVLLFLTITVFGQIQHEKKNLLFLKSEMKYNESIQKTSEWSSRKIDGLIYSAVIPGSGQYFLGHKLKGALITLGFSATLVTAIVSANNFVGNKERIDNLQVQYLSADKYSTADYYWGQLQSVYDEQKANQTRRDISIYAAIGIWALNIVDYIFLSDDLGVSEFSGVNLKYPTNTDLTLINFSFPLN